MSGKLPEELRERFSRDPEAVGLTRALADTITDTEHFAQDAGGKLWHYERGVYKQHGERTIRVKVKKLLEEWGSSKKWTTNRGNEVVEYIRVDAPELWDRPPTHQVNVLNGILDTNTRELLEHGPNFLSATQIPVMYDPEAECPAWDRFIEQTFPEDAQRLAYEIPAWLMLPDTSIQKAVLLLGEGANGKSTYLNAVMEYIGRRSLANLSLQKIEGDRFAASRLVGKLANICPDLPSDHLSSTSVFKALTGGDPVQGEYKYRESFEFMPYARLVFSANHAPRSGDASHAFYRRWLVVPFDNTFEPSEQRPRSELDASLADPRELSGVLNKSLTALASLRARGFTEAESTRQAHEEFRKATDPLDVWLDNNTITHPDAMVARDELMRRYAEVCEAAGRPTFSRKAFYQAVGRAKPGLEVRQRTWQGESNVRVWVGLGLRKDGPGGGSDTPGSSTALQQLQQLQQDHTTCCVQNNNNSSNNSEKAVDGVDPVDGNSYAAKVEDRMRELEGEDF
jgi:putative DNA primase/helicase